MIITATLAALTLCLQADGDLVDGFMALGKVADVGGILALPCSPEAKEAVAEAAKPFTDFLKTHHTAYRSTKGAWFFVRIVTEERRERCLELRFQLDSTAKGRIEQFEMRTIDARIGLAQVFWERVQSGQDPSSVILAYRTKEVEEWVKVNLVHLEKVRQGMVESGIRNEDAYARSGSRVVLTCRSFGEGVELKGSAFQVVFEFHKPVGRLLINNLSLRRPQAGS